jgi:hypothetical protein
VESPVSVSAGIQLDRQSGTLGNGHAMITSGHQYRRLCFKGLLCDQSTEQNTSSDLRSSDSYRLILPQYRNFMDGRVTMITSAEQRCPYNFHYLIVFREKNPQRAD